MNHDDTTNINSASIGTRYAGGVPFSAGRQTISRA